MGGGCGNAESSGSLVCCTRDHCAPGSLIGGPGPPERRAWPGCLLGGACVTSSRCPPSPPAVTVADGYAEGRTRRLTRGAGPGGPRVGDSGQPCPASCGSPMSAACFWVTGPLGGSGGRTASVRRCAGGLGALEGHAGDAGRLVKSGLASEVLRRLPAWFGLGGTRPRPGQVRCQWPRESHGGAGGRAVVQSPGLLQMQAGSKAETDPGFSWLRFSVFSSGQLHTRSRVSLAV